MKTREQELVESYPAIAWREPQHMVVEGGKEGYVCRFCVAMIGFKAVHDQDRIQSFDEIARHIAEVHPT